MIFDPEPTAVMAIRPSPADASLPWHTLSAEDAAQRLGSDLESGLAANDAAQRLARDGPNEIREQGRRSLFAMIAAQFKDFMILVLIAAALVSGLVGDAEDTFVIVAIVLLNAMIGFIQDFRAERAMAALKRLAALKATVLRDGHLQTVPAAEIVAGDIVLLEAGSAVPADLRLIAAPRLKVTEAALTGESVPIDKRVEPLADPTLGLADRTNMAFKGTTIT
jgi:Ca2+-transporting ATPase